MESDNQIVTRQEKKIVFFSVMKRICFNSIQFNSIERLRVTRIFWNENKILKEIKNMNIMAMPMTMMMIIISVLLPGTKLISTTLFSNHYYHHHHHHNYSIYIFGIFWWFCFSTFVLFCFYNSGGICCWCYSWSSSYDCFVFCSFGIGFFFFGSFLA